MVSVNDDDSGKLEEANDNLSAARGELRMAKHKTQNFSPLVSGSNFMEGEPRPSGALVGKSSMTEVVEGAQSRNSQLIMTAVSVFKDECRPTDIITHRAQAPENPFYYSPQAASDSKSTLLRYSLSLFIILYAATLTVYIMNRTLACLGNTSLEIVMLFAISSSVSVFVVMPLSSCLLAVIGRLTPF